MSSEDKSIRWLKALSHGFFRRCPCCGKGKMFEGYLTPKVECSACHLDYTPLKADDGPAYITMGLVCMILVPLFFLYQALYEPPFLLALGVSLPLTVLVILGILPLIKGAFMAAVWKSGAKVN